MPAYRKGGIGALMDEYERATSDLKLLIGETADDDFIRVVDPQTKDENCRTLQTILSHVVRAGYGYADHIRNAFSITSTAPTPRLLSLQEVIAELDAMLGYTDQTLEGKWEMTDEQIEAVIIHSRWGVVYNLEQLLEHAIVHILRHRRQIQRLTGRELR